MRKTKGYVLVSVMIIMSLMLVLTYFLSDALFSELAIARNQKAATASFHLAEAGVQEAVWRLQYDTSSNGAQEKFLTSIDGQTTFSHNPALLSGGSYNVTIKNTAKAAATITATGLYKFGLKTAQRKITANVTKADTPPPYDYSGAIFTGGSTGEEDITISTTELNITGDGSLISNRDIWFTHSTVNVQKDIIAKRIIKNTGSTITVGGISSENDPGIYNMPTIDITSNTPYSYKSKAIAQNQYFTASDFKNNLQSAGSLTYNGIVYIAGSSGITIDSNESLIINGVLVIEGSIDIGKPSQQGTLTINHVDGAPSGLITLGKTTCWAGSVVNISGLVYIGDRFSFDPYLTLANKNINVRGGILARRFEGRGARTINIEYNRDLINEGLRPDGINPGETPIIQFQHWEEEY